MNNIEMNVPDIGDDEVEVTEILVKVGDKVEVDQSLITVEGDKASMEVPASAAGTVKAILVKIGDKVKTGSPMMTFESEAISAEKAAPTEKLEPEKAQTTSQEPAQSVEKTVAIPDIGDDEVEVTEILVKIGDKVEVDQSLITVEGDKASMEVPASEAGTVKSILVNIGDKVKTGTLMMVLESKAESSSNTQTAPQTVQTEPKQEVAPAAEKSKAMATEIINSSNFVGKNEFVENSAYAHATPSVRQMARELGVNLAKVTPTGRKNRVLKIDVDSYVKKAVQFFESGAISSGALSGMLPWPKVDFRKFGDIEEQPLTKIQKVSGANLHRNWVMIPHVTEFDETDITDLEAFRKQQNVEAEKAKLDVKITPLVFIMKAVANALQAYPRFNSSLSEDAQTLILKKYIHIGVAVDTPNGLVVPVFKDVNQKSIIELSRELAVISKKAREGKLTGSDMQGGCFTISSLGGIGTNAFTPIVNAPEVAILGVSRSSIKPIWNGKEFAPRLMLPLSLSFDHRVIDGADGARFLTHITKVLADLRRLVM